jgi:hypothetical protein
MGAEQIIQRRGKTAMIRHDDNGPEYIRGALMAWVESSSTAWRTLWMLIRRGCRGEARAALRRAGMPGLSGGPPNLSFAIY